MDALAAEISARSRGRSSIVRAMSFPTKPNGRKSLITKKAKNYAAGKHHGKGEQGPSSNVLQEMSEKMAGYDDTRDKVIRTEEKVDALTKTVSDIDAKLTGLVALHNQAKGARWLLGALLSGTSLVSAIGGVKLSQFLGLIR